MEDDLTWLARNVHVWPKRTIDGEYRETLLWIEPSKGGVKAAFSSNPLHCFDRDQWLARRAELQNKPIWDEAPAEANYMAQEPHGIWTFFADQPFEPSKFHNDGWRFDGFQAWSADRRGEVLGDWRDTLEQRPADLSDSAVTDRMEEPLSSNVIPGLSGITVMSDDYLPSRTMIVSADLFEVMKNAASATGEVV